MSQPPIGPYLFDSLLGQGSCGPTYKAVHTDTQDVVAIKEFRTQASAGTALVNQLFHREMSYLWSLNHPNIIRCIDLLYGVTGRHFLVLEFANQGSLRDLLNEQNQLSENEALEILLDIASGLQHAHDYGIAHRDLKPENVLCHREHDLRIFKIADLGIALPLHQLTASKACGSPAYMAPEQFYGQSSIQSDLYSLGVMLYEMLTGDLPFSGSPQELAKAHASEELNWTDLVQMKSFALLQRLLAKQPEDRPESSQEVIDACWELLGRAEGPKNARHVRIVAPATPPDMAPWSSAEFALQFRRPSPGGLNLFVPFPYDTDELWVRDERSTDVIRCQRYHPRYFSHGVQCLSPAAGPEPYAYYSSSNVLYRRDPQGARTQKILELGVHPRAIIALHRQQNLEGFCILSDGRLERIDPRGRTLWTRPVSSFGVDAQMCLSGDWLVLAHSGSQHYIEWLDLRHGQVQAKVPLVGPVMSMVGREQKSERGDLDLYVLDVSLTLGRCRKQTYQWDKQFAETEIPSDVYGVAAYRDLDFLHRVDDQAFHQTDIVTPGGQTVGTIPTDGAVIAQAWNGGAQVFSWLERVSGSTFLAVGRLNSTSERSSVCDYATISGDTRLTA